jgi:hypothetical protein
MYTQRIRHSKHPLLEEKMQPRFALLIGLVLSLALSACGGTEAAIATGIAQTQQISQLETAAAGNNQPVASEEPAQAEAATATTAQSQVTTKQDVNMRSGDSTAYGVMTVIPGGETLQITGINQAGTWYQVRYHDATGWVSVEFTNGEPPAGLAVVSAPPVPTSSGGGGGGGGGGGSGGGGDSNYSFTLDLSNDGESSTVSGELTEGDTDYVTVKFEGLGGSMDTGHLRVQLSCSAYEEEVELSESIPRSNHSNECNGDWDYQIEETDSELVIGMYLPSGYSGTVEWTMTVEVNT